MLSHRHVSESSILRKSSCNYLRGAISHQNKLALVIHNDVIICSDLPPYATEVTMKCTGHIRDVCWGPPSQYENYVAICTEDYIALLAMPGMLGTTKVIFDRKIPVICIQWQSQNANDIQIVCSTAVYKTTLSLDEKHQLRGSELTLVSKGRFGAAGVSRCLSGALLYGATTIGSCGVNFQLESTENLKTKSIQAQSPYIITMQSNVVYDSKDSGKVTHDASTLPSISEKVEFDHSKFDVSYETRCLESAGTLHWKYRLDHTSFATLAGHVFVVASEKQLSLSNSAATIRSHPSSAEDTATLDRAPASVLVDSLAATQPATARGLISIVSSCSTPEEESSEVYADVDSSSREDSQSLSRGAFPHVLAGTSLREALAVPLHISQQDGGLGAPCTENRGGLLSGLQNIHLTNSTGNAEPAEEHKSRSGGKSIHSMVSVGILMESNGASKEVRGLPRVIISPALPLELIPSTQSNDKIHTATDISFRPDVLSSYVYMCDSCSGDGAGGSRSCRSVKRGEQRFGLWVAVGSSGSSCVFLIHATYVWPLCDNLDENIRHGQWTIRLQKEFWLPDSKMRCKGLAFCKEENVPGIDGPLELRCLAAEPLDTHLTSLSTMGSFATSLVSFSIPHMSAMPPPEKVSRSLLAEDYSGHVNRGEATVSPPNPPTAVATLDSILFAVEEMHRTVKMRLDGIETRLSCQEEKLDQLLLGRAV